MTTLQAEISRVQANQSNFGPATPCIVTPGDMARCRTRPALALLLHLRMTNDGQLRPIVPEVIGLQMSPCLSAGSVRLALDRLIEGGLVEAFEACPIPRRQGAGRPITHLYNLLSENPNG